MSLYVLSLTLHLLAAMTWIGGMIFFGLVGAPAVRRVQDAAVRRELFDRLGRRFRAVGWAAVVLLVATGALNLHLAGALAAALGAEPAFWGSPFGRALGVKLLLVIAMLVVAGIHDAWLGPAAARAEGTARAGRLSMWARLLGRVGAVLGVLAVWAATMLTRGA